MRVKKFRLIFLLFALERGGGLLSGFLKKIEPKWCAMMEKPFLKGIVTGKLSKGIFLKYLIQDTLYLRDYVKGYAFAITKTDKIEVIRLLVNCLRLIEKDEAAIHVKYLKDYGYTEDEALMKNKNKINEEYLNYMLEKSKEGSLSEGIISLLPCAYSYHYIFTCCKIKAKQEATCEKNYYIDYINYYSSAEYANGLKVLNKLCDVIFKNVETSEENLYKIFEKSTEYEAKFWDMPML